MPSLFLLLLFQLTLRVFVAFGSHSGEGDAPRYGDFEAQRHWIELTSHLPPSQWYVHGPQNDLQHWGLDYPPLSAWFSAAVGVVGTRVAPDAFALVDSIGHESARGKAFMRASVLLLDAVCFMAPAVALARVVARTPSQRRASLRVLLFQPALLLIDHGHFQYNCVCLGFVLCALVAVRRDAPLAAALAVTLALCFKQMALYFAPAFAVYVVARFVVHRRSLRTLALLVLVTLATLALTFAPWLRRRGALVAVVARLFPWNRGLYEDMVANFWCTLSPLYKAKQRLSLAAARRACTLATLAAIAPPLFNVARYGAASPTPRAARRFLYALASTSLAFFLFAYQVHEKSLLLPLCAVAALGAADARRADFVVWFNLVALFSMSPLLARDGLAPQYVALLVAFVVAFDVSAVARRAPHVAAATAAPMLAVHAAGWLLTPPARLPHLFVLACTSLSFIYLACAYVLLLKWQFAEVEEREKEKRS